MTRQITPDEAHSIAPDVVAGERPVGSASANATVEPKASEPSAHGDTPAQPLDHATIRAIVAGIMLAMFLSALEQTIVAPALPAIGKSLGDVDNLSWVVTAYLLAATVTTPLFGKLSDIYGRRTILLVAIGFFIAGSVACAVAPTIWLLIAARGLQNDGAVFRYGHGPEFPNDDLASVQAVAPLAENDRTRGTPLHANGDQRHHRSKRDNGQRPDDKVKRTLDQRIQSDDG